MIVTVNMSKEVWTYFKDYLLDDLINCLLEQYDFTNLPAMTPTERKNTVERKVNVVDPIYIQLYQAVGPRSKKVSLGRLLEFAYGMDVLSNPLFKVKPIDRGANPAPSLIDKAYKILLDAKRYDPDNRELRLIVELIYELRR